ncbi:TPM domain-containing protein [Leuconostocaceae bacterium ESL0958]|nr:TPM domain-containing protein [Leuconostocaceae bacterium ESL0958]
MTLIKGFFRPLCLLLLAVCAASLLLTQSAAAEDPNSLQPDSRYPLITDRAKVLSDKTKETVRRQNQTFQKSQQQAQVGILTVDNTDGLSIRDFTNDLTLRKAWQLGSKKENNGVLIVFAKNNGANNVRVVTGTGAEAVLPDGKIRQLLAKYQDDLKSNQNEAVDRGLRQLFQELATTLPSSGRAQQNQQVSPWLIAGVLVVLVAVFAIWRKLRRQYPSQANRDGLIDEQDQRGSGWGPFLFGWLLGSASSGYSRADDDHYFDGGSDFDSGDFGGSDDFGGGDFGGGGSDF